MNLEKTSYPSNSRWIILIVMVTGLFISTSLALLAFKAMSERIEITTKYIVAMKSNVIQERLINQNNHLLYISKFKDSFGVKNVKQLNDSLLHDDEKAVIGQYWAYDPSGKQSFQIETIEKITQEKRLQSKQYDQLESSLKKFSKEKIKNIENSPDLLYFDYVEILDQDDSNLPLLLISKAIYKNEKKSILSGVLIRVLDLKKLFHIDLPMGTVSRNFFGILNFPLDLLGQHYHHELSIDGNARLIETDKKKKDVLINPSSKKIISLVKSDFRINNAEVNISLSGSFLANPLKISSFIFFLGLAFSGLLAFLITRGMKIQMQINEQNNLKQNQIERSNFFDTLAHELRTPLNGILGMSNLLLKSSLDPAQYHYSSAIKQSGYLMNLMVDQTLTASRMQSYDIKIVNEVFIFNQLVDQIIDGLGPLADVKQLTFSYDLPMSMNGVPFYGDELRIRQVLINLLGNAIKFTKEGYVRLSISEEKHHQDPLTPWIRFDVIDSGIGLTKEEREELFKKFGRLKKDKFVSASEGGLGLYISQKTVRLMGGTLDFQSTPQSGSNFFFKIPMKKYDGQIDEDSNLSSLVDKHVVILSSLTNEDANQYKKLLEQNGAIVYMFDKFLTIRKHFISLKRQSITPDLIYICQTIDEIEGLKFFNDIQNWLNLDISSRIIYLHTTTNSVARFNVISSGVKHTQLIPVEHRYLLSQAKKVILENATIPLKKLKDQSSLLQGSIFENNLNVLVADDNLLNQEIVSIMLQNLGYQVSVVKNGVEVLHVLDQDSFDIILMDINMPELNGVEATIQIRKSNKPYNKIPILAMSANIGDKFISLCLENGMNTYMAKPIEIEALDRKIMEILLYPQGS